MGSQFELDYGDGPGQPPLTDGILAEISGEQRRLLELEELCASVAALPDGWEWRSTLRVGVIDGAWVVRGTLVPGPVDQR